MSNLLRQLATTRDQVDLIVDFQAAETNGTEFARLLARIPEIDEWHSITLLAGAFPKDLADLEKNRQHKLPRRDLAAWEECLAASATRELRFGDYTIQHPTFEDHENEGRNFSASIRYTAPNYWVVMRGEGVKNKSGSGYAQWPAQASLLKERPEFKGDDYCWGDKYIAEMSRSFTRTGGPKQWLSAGVNHHITLTAKQVAALAASARRRPMPA